MEKIFDSYSNAKFYKRLYNTFPYHAKAQLKKKSNILEYKFVPWKERYDVILLWDYNYNVKLCKILGNILWKFHFKNCKIRSWYENICLKRNYVNWVNFIHSNLYEWNIHGDLHLRNIIVNENWIFFIDRLSERGDIMFDFPFIMSLLWFRFKTNNKKYLDYIVVFFIHYSKYIKWCKWDFFVSFRNNFINYWIICSKISDEREDFPEWKYWKEISKRLQNENDFIWFITRLYNDWYNSSRV